MKAQGVPESLVPPAGGRNMALGGGGQGMAPGAGDGDGDGDGGKVLVGARLIPKPEEVPGRDESPLERLDRNTGELLQGLRVAGTGIQVVFAFLLILPFNARFSKLNGFERGVYMVTLICIAIAAVLMIAPSIHHRLLFRRGQKRFLVEVGNRLMIIAGLFMAVGLTGAMLLISEFVLGGAAAIAIAVCGAVTIVSVWFAVPLNRCRQLDE